VKHRLLLALLAPLAIGGTLSAHHSFSSYYFEDQSVTLEGDVVEFEYRAPHAWIRFNVSDEQGRANVYGAEWANPARLNRDGVTKDTIKPGDKVTITGSPGRKDADRVVHLKRIDRPSDGWSWRGRQRGR
jgi:hypothetical protein